MAVVEASSLSELVWLSQMRASYPDSVGRLGAFQDKEEDAHVSWQFVKRPRKHEGLLGIGQWPRPEDCGPGDDPVWLDIQCIAMGSRQGRRVKEMRIEVLKLLVAAFHGRMAPGPSGQSWRDSKDARIPYNLDNRCALQVALVDKKVDSMVVEAVVGLEDDQQVLHFWEDLCGLECCSDECLDRKEELTDLTRLARVNGASMRQLLGMWAFIDSCFMFCGTRWILDVSIAVPTPALPCGNSGSQWASALFNLRALESTGSASCFDSWTTRFACQDSTSHEPGCAHCNLRKNTRAGFGEGLFCRVH
jgi:hypothetical protein